MADYPCSDCGELFDPDDIVDCGGVMLCVECADAADWMRCDLCEHYHDRDDMHECDNEFLCDRCAESRGWDHCRVCNSWEIMTDRDAPTGYTDYCEDCFNDRFAQCDSCGDYYDRNDLFCTDEGEFCEDCRPTGDFEPGCFDNTGGTVDTGSARCYGLELETDVCEGYEKLDGRGPWGAKDDPTCCGKEFYSAILSGDDGLGAVADIAHLASQYDWEISSDCGYHLHIDMRDEGRDSLFAIAYAYRATQSLWGKFTTSRRRAANYCHAAEWDCADMVGYAGSFKEFICDFTTGRYNWLNLRAYFDHRTFEIRLHHASLTEKEICNWIKAHVRFVDWASRVGWDEVRDKLCARSPSEQFDIIAREAWKDDELSDYYARKAGYKVISA